MIINLVLNILQHIFITALQHDTIPSVLAVDYLSSIELVQHIPLHIVEQLPVVTFETDALVVLLVELLDRHFKPLLEFVLDPLHFQRDGFGTVGRQEYSADHVCILDASRGILGRRFFNLGHNLNEFFVWF